MQRRYVILGVVLLAIALHGAAAFSVAERVHSRGGEYPAFGNDALGYKKLGENIYQKGIFSRSEGEPYLSESFRTPGYPVLIAAALWLGGSFSFLIVLQILASGVIAFLLFRLAEEAGLGERAWIAGLFGAIEPAGLFLSGVLLTETIYTALFLGALLFVVRRDERLFLGGALLGLATLVRPSGMIILIPLILWIVLSNGVGRLKRVIFFVLGWTIIVSPWIIRNGQMFGVYAISDVVERKMLLYDAPIYAGERLGKGVKEMTEDVRVKLFARTGKAPRELTLADREGIYEIIDGYIDSWPRFMAFSAVRALPFFGANEIGAIGGELGFFENHKGSLSGALFSGNFASLWRMLLVRKWSALEYVFWAGCFFFAAVGAWRGFWIRDRTGSVRVLFFSMLILTALGTGVVATYRLRYPVSGLFIVLALGASIAHQKEGFKSTWTRVDDMLRLFRLRKIERFVPKHGVLIDLGCGHEAYMLRYFQPRMKELWGYDKDVAPIDEGALHVRSFALSEAIPREDVSADVVTLCAALEHFPDDVAIIREARRVLRPDGVLLVTVPSVYAKPVLEVLAFLRVISPEEIHDHKRYYTPNIVRKVFRDAGFSEEEIVTRYWQFGFNCFARAVKTSTSKEGDREMI